jgi:hypothetical protein
MTKRWMKLRDGDGQFFDRLLGVHVRKEEIVRVPDPLPSGSKTAQWLNGGGLIFCDPPEAIERAADDGVDADKDEAITVPSEESSEDAVEARTAPPGKQGKKGK